MNLRAWTIGVIAAASGLMVAQGGAYTVGYNFGADAANKNTTSGTPFASSVGAMSVGNTFGSIATNPNTTNPSTGYANASGGFNFDQVARDGALATGTSAYYAFTVTPTAGNKLQLVDFDFGALSTSTGPLSYVLRWSVDSYAATDLVTGSLSPDGVWAQKDNSFSTVSAPSTGAVTFRLYFFGGTGSVSGTSNVSIDDVRVTLAVPEASDCALYACAGIVGLTWVGRRWRAQKQKA